MLAPRPEACTLSYSSERPERFKLQNKQVLEDLRELFEEVAAVLQTASHTRYVTMLKAFFKDVVGGKHSVADIIRLAQALGNTGEHLGLAKVMSTEHVDFDKWRGSFPNRVTVCFQAVPAFPSWQCDVDDEAVAAFFSFGEPMFTAESS